MKRAPISLRFSCVCLLSAVFILSPSLGSLVSTPSVPRGHSCSRKAVHFQQGVKLRLKGGAQDEAHVEDEKYQERERIFQQLCKEWEYCMGGDGEEGRPLHPDQEPYTGGDIEVPGWNHDGTNPGPEVWKKPSKQAIRMGFTVDPLTAPIRTVMEDVARMAREADEERERVEFEGPHLLPNQLPPNPHGDRYVYWDREQGTRPWPNFRKQLPPGYYQLRMCGSCIILKPDRTFVHTDDFDNHDPNTWGELPEDRGEWSIDAETYEESTVVTLAFHDEERTVCSLKRNQQNCLAGQKTFYTGEIPQLDEELGERPANVYEGVLCGHPECEMCTSLEAQGEVDELALLDKHCEQEVEGPQLPPWEYAAQCLPQEPPLQVPLWSDG